MQLILRSFFRGLLFVVPVSVTIYVVRWLFVTLDGLLDLERWLGFSMPGLGVVLTVAGITVVGFLASNFLTRWLVQLMDRIFRRAPLAKIIYSSLKDLTEAFVGEQKKFDRPVLVSLGDVGEALGFVTREDLAWMNRADAVAVYFPQSYNFAGSVVIFPRDRLTPLDVDAGGVMRFIVSGGVSGGG